MFGKFILHLRLWLTRARTRREIWSLDPRTIHDLGQSQSQMAFEAQKPFWRA